MLEHIFKFSQAVCNSILAFTFCLCRFSRSVRGESLGPPRSQKYVGAFKALRVNSFSFSHLRFFVNLFFAPAVIKACFSDLLSVIEWLLVYGGITPTPPKAICFSVLCFFLVIYLGFPLWLVGVHTIPVLL